MIHFRPTALFRAQTPLRPAELTPAAPVALGYGRADHARMLAHAAKRRQAAQRCAEAADEAYWKACAPAAVVRAAAIRAEPAFARLP